jgi:NAD(P)-dependent dehydrogenase (short-subunit alcohol dehydrogenase family)
MEQRFKEAAVLISGAARGFGKMAARQFAAEGARLVLTDILGAELETTANEIRDSGARVITLEADIALEDTARRLVEESVRAYGRLDIAVNNAGIAHPYTKLAEIDSATMERVLRVNLMGVFYAMKHQIPRMERQKAGVILNVASVAGLIGAPLLGVYAAAKHGVVGLTKTAALEYVKSGIRINAICPSFAATPMVTDAIAQMRGAPSEALTRTLAAIPMRRLARPEEVVQAMLWLCSPQNSFVTGAAIPVDGGLTAG